MTHRPNLNSKLNVSSTDVLIAMLTSDLRGSWAEGNASRSREHIDPAGSGPLPAIIDPGADPIADTEKAGSPGAPERPTASRRPVEPSRLGDR